MKRASCTTIFGQLHAQWTVFAFPIDKMNGRRIDWILSFQKTNKERIANEVAETMHGKYFAGHSTHFVFNILLHLKVH